MLRRSTRSSLLRNDSHSSILSLCVLLRASGIFIKRARPSSQLFLPYLLLHYPSSKLTVISSRRDRSRGTRHNPSHYTLMYSQQPRQRYSRGASNIRHHVGSGRRVNSGDMSDARNGGQNVREGAITQHRSYNGHPGLNQVGF